MIAERVKSAMMYAFREPVDAGGLMCYTTRLQDLFGG